VTDWTATFLPFALVMARVAAFFGVLPLFSWRALPVRIRTAMAVLMAVFFARIVATPNLGPGPVAPMTAIILMANEALVGLALGLAVNLVFRSVQVGARFAGRQMGFAIANVMDPNTGEQASPVGLIFEMCFMLLFFVAGGHHLLVLIMNASFQAFPLAGAPDIGMLVEGLIVAGGTMMVMGLKLAGPVIAAFVVLSVLLGVLARVLPEMNILMLSFPLRIALGLLMAAALMPMLNDFTLNLAGWMSRFFITETA